MTDDVYELVKYIFPDPAINESLSNFNAGTDTTEKWPSCPHLYLLSTSKCVKGGRGVHVCTNSTNAGFVESPLSEIIGVQEDLHLWFYLGISEVSAEGFMACISDTHIELRG